jgi:hypothetical protein
MDGMLMSGLNQSNFEQVGGGWISKLNFSTYNTSRLSFPGAPACSYLRAQNVNLCPPGKMSFVKVRVDTIASVAVPKTTFQTAADGYVFPAINYPGGSPGGYDHRPAHFYTCNLFNGAFMNHSSVRNPIVNMWSRLHAYLLSFESHGYASSLRVPPLYDLYFDNFMPGDWIVLLVPVVSNGHTFALQYRKWSRWNNATIKLCLL